ncbi:bicaudal-D-related protein 2-like [Gadus chalcogrammus]|uniref:bicaudal-D-related protein 2-like n=1 Tax=Gadus chalcogrammus TaxID=1042646 RepID=UPI0024C3600B|nr:bicaudal-D-related protein 2-like [Gadus chalcogrammus]
MEGSLPFSALNDRLRPHSTPQRLYAPPSIWEDRQTPRPLREGPSGGGARPTPYQGRPDPEESNAGSEEPAEEDSETGSLDSDGGSSMNEDQGNRSDLLSLLTQCLDPAMRLTDTGSEGLEDPAEGRPDASSPSSTERSSDLPEGSSSCPARETGRGADSRGADPRGADRSLPDLLRGSGRPLSRRRTLGPVSDTLKEVRREVALSRSRSIRLKAQVDKLQEEGPGWSQHRERVTEEVLSILKLLRPLSDARLVEPSSSADRLDAGLSQLQHVARSLALSHGNQSSGVGKRSEDMAILEQALRDRDEAIEKKKGMEAELLRSKSEMMCLNNQLLEAVQKRLELSLELEAWKEDLQYILNQQLQQQQSQQAEETQKRSRGGLLRRTHRVPVQRPDPPAPAPAPSLSRAFKGRFRRGKVGRQGDQEPAGPDVQQASATGFQTVSLD